MKVFIGYDPTEDIAFEVAKFSLIRRASIPLKVFSLRLPHLKEAGLFERPHDELQSTEFTYTRFLTPYLSNFVGWSLFVDCDFLFLDDIAKLFAQADPNYAVMVVKHDYKPTETSKMDGLKQTVYPRKNWSSFVLFNNAHPANRILNPDVVNQSHPSFLHRFQWLQDEQIGEVEHRWNYLEGWYPSDVDVSTLGAIHYTRGGPWHKNHAHISFCDVWREEKERYEQS